MPTTATTKVKVEKVQFETPFWVVTININGKSEDMKFRALKDVLEGIKIAHDVDTVWVPKDWAGAFKSVGIKPKPAPAPQSAPLVRVSKPVNGIKVKSVKVERAEGPTEECVPHTFEGPDAMEEAQTQMTLWSKTAPGKGHGYDKCDFVVTFEDGETYEGRYDLQDTGLNDSGDTISYQMHHFLGFMAGSYRPGWIDDEKWDKACKYHKESGEAQSAREFLEKYTF